MHFLGNRGVPCVQAPLGDPRNRQLRARPHRFGSRSSRWAVRLSRWPRGLATGDAARKTLRWERGAGGHWGRGTPRPGTGSPYLSGLWADFLGRRGHFKSHGRCRNRPPPRPGAQSSRPETGLHGGPAARLRLTLETLKVDLGDARSPARSDGEALCAPFALV